MKHVLVVAGLVAILSGCLLMLPLLAWASIQDPRWTGAEYVAAVLKKLLSGRAAWATAAGSGAIVLGLAGVLYSVYLAEPDGSDRKQAIPAFWAALLVTSLTTFTLLVGVNYLGLQAGGVPPIWRWVTR